MSTPSDGTILLRSHLDGRVLVATLNRPAAGNAINGAVADELNALATQLERSPSIEAVILTGSGRVFCGGGDVAAFRASLEADGENSEGFTQLLSDLSLRVHAALERIIQAGPLLVAAVNGPATGAGLGLICACDYAFARPSATLRAGFSRLGISPDSSTTYFLPRIIGYRKALDVLVGGEAVEAESALALGIYTRLLDAGDEQFLDQAIAATVKLIASGQALRETRRLLQMSGQSTLGAQLELERLALIGLSRDARVLAHIRQTLGPSST
jgi:2-(1,2-epoxy-1,2-dihydrophenyl)acetyl-CoA isomerase